MKCQWILPQFVKDVEYARVRDIDFKSAQKLKSELENDIDNLSSKCEDHPVLKEKENISAPSKAEMNDFYSELSKCKTKPVVLSVVGTFAQHYILPSRRIPTVPNLFDPKYLNMPYLQLIDACMNIKLSITREEIKHIEKDTIKQAKGMNFFKHRAGKQCNIHF